MELFHLIRYGLKDYNVPAGVLVRCMYKFNYHTTLSVFNVYY